jgi:hypothetical protein
LILDLRLNRKLGVRRIQSELKRNYDFSVSLATIHKYLKRNNIPSEWEFYYNWHRPHSSLNGKTPNEKYSDLIFQTPLWEEIEYDSKKERIIPPQNFKVDSYIKKLKLSLRI